MTAWLQDVRYALRALAKRPLYATLTIAVLAIAIGANTTVFTVLNSLLLRPLPYADGDRLVMVYDAYPKMGLEIAGTSIAAYLERRAQTAALEDLAIVATDARTLNDGAAPERVLVTRASPSLLNVLRTAPALGRGFTDDEATPGNDRVAMLGHRLWSTRFGARTDVIGQDIRLDGVALRIVGVLPAGFAFPERDVDAYVPFAYTAQQASDTERDRQYAFSIGRLQANATLAALNAELEALVRSDVVEGRVKQEVIDVAGYTAGAQLWRTVRVQNFASMVLILQATVLAVLLIACANVANLQLARALARRRELAVRAALGAGARRLIRLVLVESLVLASGAVVAGLALALGGLEVVRALGLEQAASGFEFTPDATVLAFTVASGAAAALIAGLPPVIALLRDDPMRAVHEAGRQDTGGPRTHALRGALVVAQIALSIGLVYGASLLTKSFYTLQSAGPGFSAASVWTAKLSLPRARYATPASWPQLQERALEKLRALPGVGEAGFTSVLPFGGPNEQGSIVLDGDESPPGAMPPHAQHRSISAGYLPALGVTLVAGRNFAATEPDRVAIVDENLAAKYWPQGNAVGQRLRHVLDPPDRWYTIVGVAAHVKQDSLAEAAAKDTVYWHYQQRPVTTGDFALRTTLPTDQLTRAASATIAALDPDLAIYDVLPMDLRVARSLGPQRAPMVLTVLFAVIAFTLAVIGIYGVLTWTVTQRLGEIGVRMALGARAQDIVRMVLQQGGRLIAVGVAFGIVAAVALGVVLASQIANIDSFDPIVLCATVLALSGAALLASWVPAFRAAHTDPLRALRAE